MKKRGFLASRTARKVPVKKRQNFLQCRQSFDEHRHSLDEKDISNFIDLYIMEIRRQKEHGDDIVFDEGRVWRGIFDMFFAGSGSTSTTMLWAIFLMAKFPDVLKEVIGVKKKHFLLFFIFNNFLPDALMILKL